MESLLHGLFTSASLGQPLELIHIPIQVLNVLAHRVGTNKLYGSGFHPQILFWQWLPLVPMDGMVVFTLTGHGSMQKHLMVKELVVKAAW